MNHAELLKLLLPPTSYAPNGSVIGAELAIDGTALDAAMASANRFASEAFPDTTVELLAEWERAYGLPDVCVSAIPTTIGGRQAVLFAKVMAHGGLSKAYFIALALALGYVITITGFLPHSVEDDVEASLWDETWRFAWQVNAPAVTVHDISVEDDVETPIRWWGNDLLECVMRRLGPAHMQVLFAYI